MRFVSWDEAAAYVRGKRVAIVGSAPSVLQNEPGFVEEHDVVCRINNYKTGPAQGGRTDIHYSFFGGSIRKTADDLKRDGVRLLWNKCPNAKPIESEWHEKNGKQNGIDFSYIYRARADFWFGDVYEPTVEQFLRTFELLDGRIPTTGFAAILDILECGPESAYLTGFDFFSSRMHNVDERWRPGDPTDPIGHRPDLEQAWLAANLGNYPITLDRRLTELVNMHRAAA